MDKKDTFSDLVEIDSDEFKNFLDTLQEVFEEDIEKGIPAYER